MSVGDDENAVATGPTEAVNAGPQKEACNACMLLFAVQELTEVRCTHRYCSACLHCFFKRALKDETLYPPACCAVAIPLRVASPRLSKSFTRRYKAKQLELKTRNRTYCHRPACSAFIAPHSIHNGHACCQRCGSVTCGYCKSAWHWGRCSEGDDSGFFDFVKTTEWKRCPECKRMIEKNEGCNHIVYVVHYQQLIESCLI